MRYVMYHYIYIILNLFCLYFKCVWWLHELMSLWLDECQQQQQQLLQKLHEYFESEGIQMKWILPITIWTNCTAPATSLRHCIVLRHMRWHTTIAFINIGIYVLWFVVESMAPMITICVHRSITILTIWNMRRSTTQTE